MSSIIPNGHVHAITDIDDAHYLCELAADNETYGSKFLLLAFLL